MFSFIVLIRDATVSKYRFYCTKKKQSDYIIGYTIHSPIFILNVYHMLRSLTKVIILSINNLCRLLSDLSCIFKFTRCKKSRTKFHPETRTLESMFPFCDQIYQVFLKHMKVFSNRSKCKDQK